ncbi:hypothetical protein V8E51_005029 [Hyaloscypha variabilis]
MEGLQELAKEMFEKEQQFRQVSSPIDLINISASPSEDMSYGVVEVHNRYLVSALDGEATLKVVRILREDNEILNISRDLFMEIFQLFEIEAYILYLISRNSYGFHRFEATKSSSNDSLSSFFLGTVLYVLIWSFNPRSLKTRAMLLTRRSSGLHNDKETFRQFQNILRFYKNYVYTPGLLAFVAGAHIIQFVDEYILLELRLIRSIEAGTGHGTWRSELPRVHGHVVRDELTRKSDDITLITRSSGMVGGCLVDLANNARHAEIASSLLAFLLEKIDSSHLAQDFDRRNYDASAKALQLLVPTLQGQIKSAKSYIRYLQEQARNQSSVLFGLLTREDAIANIKLADASKQLAQSMKKDNSAMKTVAIMTMAFLPATFFAALFAVPSLQWDKPGVVQDKFWIYWAFTLPSTAFVFIAWFLITNWESITSGKNGHE